MSGFSRFILPVAAGNHAAESGLRSSHFRTARSARTHTAELVPMATATGSPAPPALPEAAVEGFRTIRRRSKGSALVYAPTATSRARPAGDIQLPIQQDNGGFDAALRIRVRLLGWSGPWAQYLLWVCERRPRQNPARHTVLGSYHHKYQFRSSGKSRLARTPFFRCFLIEPEKNHKFSPQP